MKVVQKGVRAALRSAIRQVMGQPDTDIPANVMRMEDGTPMLMEDGSFMLTES